MRARCAVTLLILYLSCTNKTCKVAQPLASSLPQPPVLSFLLCRHLIKHQINWNPTQFHKHKDKGAQQWPPSPETLTPRNSLISLRKHTKNNAFGSWTLSGLRFLFQQMVFFFWSLFSHSLEEKLKRFGSIRFAFLFPSSLVCPLPSNLRLEFHNTQHTFDELDHDKKAGGCALDELQAHRFLERHNETLTVHAMRERLRATGAIGAQVRLVPLIHVLLFKYNADWHHLVSWSSLSKITPYLFYGSSLMPPFLMILNSIAINSIIPHWF